MAATFQRASDLRDDAAAEATAFPGAACCPVCGLSRLDVLTPEAAALNDARTDLADALAALRDLQVARHDLAANEHVPEALWRSLDRAANVLDQLSPCPF